MDWPGLDFEFVRGKRDDNPYKFQNTRVANSLDKVGDTLWSAYYPELIFDKYAEGKYYAQLKMRAKFMIENDIKNDTVVQIYDIENQIISRKGKPCTFRVKRIIKVFDSGSFHYLINCLED